MKNKKWFVFIGLVVWVSAVVAVVYCLFPEVRASKPGLIAVANIAADDLPAKDATVTGVGVLVTRNDDGKFEITRVFPNSPAEKAGLAKGLVLTKVGDVVTETKQRGELFKLLIGPVGSKVVLEVTDKNGDNLRKVEITREQFLNRSGKTNADSQATASN